MGISHFFVKKFKKMKKVVKIVAFRGISGNSGWDGVLNSNPRGTGRGKMAGDLGERVPRVPRGIPTSSAAANPSGFKLGINQISVVFTNFVILSICP